MKSKQERKRQRSYCVICDGKRNRKNMKQIACISKDKSGLKIIRWRWCCNKHKRNKEQENAKGVDEK